MTSETIKALIQMFVTLVVLLCSIFGYSLAEEQAQQIAIVIAAVVVIAYSVWRNANFTHAAGYGEEITNGIKDGSIDTSAVDAFLGVLDEGIGVDGRDPQEVDDDGQQAG